MQHSLNKEQFDIIQGLLLGRGYLKQSGNMKNARLHLNFKYEDYMKCLRGKLHPYIRTNQSICHVEFTKLKNVWYYKSRKIFPYIDINDTVLTHWVVGKGKNKKKQKNYILNTSLFDEESVQFLIEQIWQVYNIKAFTTKGNILIRSREYLDFMYIIKPLIPWCSLHDRIDTSGVVGKNNDWGPYKLNVKVANDIRDLYYQQNYTQQQLANKYNVSIRTINKIVNNISYKDINFSLGGKALVKVYFNCMTYNPEMCHS